MEKSETETVPMEKLLENAIHYRAVGNVCTIAELRNRKLSALEELSGIIIERRPNLYGWGILPDIIVEKVFSYLTMWERYTASMVCHQWHRAFYMQATWNTFELDDHTLIRRKFNYYMGWQEVLDHLRTQLCLHRIGKYVRNLILGPMSNLINLFGFMNILSFYAEKYAEEKKGPCLNIKSLKFSFWCDLGTSQAERHIYGTGGEVLQSLKRLMSNLNDIQNLELIDLLLDSYTEAIHLLDDVCTKLCEQIYSLVLINTTKQQLYFLHPGCFVNLRILKMSPQNLGNELVELLISNTKQLEELHIIQNNYTEAAEAVEPRAWTNAKFKVYLWSVGKTDKEVVWQARAPVVSIIYDCPLTQVTWTSSVTASDLYSNRLEEYGHLSLPKFGRSRKFEERPDSTLLGLCRKCPYLHTLYIRERISTSTALLIVAMSPNLRYFHVRKNALILKCDYIQHNLDVDFNFIQWVKLNSKSYEKMSLAISKILGYEWRPLSDSHFKDICRRRQAY